ncbi:MAG: aconitate hydratase [Elusimicrobia bacterium]|nr:aconitate hydratase [Elusimicrobiota bacterium]
MKGTLTEKILRSHLAHGKLEPGSEIGIRIDQTLTQDATGTMAFLQLEAMGIARIRAELAVSYADHNTLQMGFENADDHRYLQSVAARYGAYYSRAGNGICHQVHLERFGKPGKTLLGSDSHTPTGGGLGMFAMGAGGIDVAVAMGGGPYYFTAPRVVRVSLEGAFRPWVSAKDIILHILSILTTKGNVGTVIEYGGEALARLSVPERATITNMGAELGVTTSLFPSDEQTKRFLSAQKRGKDFTPLAPESGAVYQRTIEVDLGKLEPLAACPHSPDSVAPVSKLRGKRVDQVCIGSCTNASYLDLMRAAAILKGKRVPPSLNLVVVPGSRQVQLMLAESGALKTFIEAGARLMEPTCGFCIGMGQAPVSGGVSLRTNNRNFEGRSGTADGQVYLVSPETAAASALAGEITDPRTLGLASRLPRELPKKFAVDDSMIVEPPRSPEKIEILRGPNIGQPPKNSPLPGALRGKVLIKLGDKVTTDHIMPAGERLKYRSNIGKYSQFVFERIDPEFHAKCRKEQAAGSAVFIVAGESYGQGSSREHAAMCPMALGVKAVLARTIERIHAANLINFGILPLTFMDPADYQALEKDDELEMPRLEQELAAGRITVNNLTRNREFKVKADFSGRQSAILKDGGLLNHAVSAKKTPEACAAGGKA